MEQASSVDHTTLQGSKKKKKKAGMEGDKQAVCVVLS